MSCIHCGSSAGKTRHNELNTEESLNLCRGLSRIPCRQVTLIGGELFLRKDWHDIAAEVKNQKMGLRLVSNGFLIDRKLAAMIARLEPEAVGISIDGSNAETHDYIRNTRGSFERAINSLKMLKERDVPVSIVTTVHKLNFKDLPKIKNIVYKKGIAWQIQIATPFGRFERKYALTPRQFYSVGLFIASVRSKYRTKDLPVTGAHDMGYYSSIMPNVQLGHWHGCQAGITNLGIQSNGNVKGCLSLPDTFIEGNVNERSIVDIWNDTNSFAYNRSFKESSLSGFCRQCLHSAVCRAGCMSVTYNFTGKRDNPYCYYKIERNTFKSIKGR
jgi:radical SAM protein with 4Fe4S-binding SPASM domain